MKLKNYIYCYPCYFFLLLQKVKQSISFYAGTFDTIDKEGDDEATLYGFEHNNPVLFRDTFVGNFLRSLVGLLQIKVLFIYTQVFKPNMRWAL